VKTLTAHAPSEWQSSLRPGAKWRCRHRCNAGCLFALASIGLPTANSTAGEFAWRIRRGVVVHANHHGNFYNRYRPKFTHAVRFFR
jgi:hypothetical protein